MRTELRAARRALLRGLKRLPDRVKPAIGYRILVNVGDQRSDLRGGAAERRIKAVNPMYFLP